MESMFEVHITLRQDADASGFSLIVERDPPADHLEHKPMIYVLADDFEDKVKAIKARFGESTLDEYEDPTIAIAEPLDGPEFGGPL